VLSEREDMRFDFETWLTQTYGLKARGLSKKELGLAKKEYAEEYPKPGESELKLKTYPFKRYLDSKRS
jgi:hypothetical protein